MGPRRARTGVPQALAGLIGLALLSVACAPADEPVGQPEQPEPPPSPTDEAVDTDASPTPLAREAEERPTPSQEPDVPEILDFTAATIDGGQVVGAEHAGQAVALWFWAPW